MKSIGRILVALLAMQATAELASRQVHCTSSYIDDYFLPTAKLALNKIQQSFSAQQTSTSSSMPSADNKTTTEQQDTTTTTTSTTTTIPTVNLDKQQAANVIQEASQRQPEESSFVNYDESARKEDQTTSSAAGPDPVTLTISSSDSVSTDPSLSIATSSEMDPTTTTSSPVSTTTTTTTVDSNRGQTADDDEQQPQIAAENIKQSVNSIEPAAPKSADEPAGLSSLSAAAASNFKEAELEAIAAVDESIAFGDLMQSRDSIDTCYDEYGNARFCEPEFENVAFERPVEVSSECGWPATRFCTTTYATLNERNDQIRNCHICDAHHSKKRHPAAYLTDINNSNSPTCWVSAPIGVRPTSAAAAAAATPVSGNQSVDSNNQQAAPGLGLQLLQRDNVSLTLNLGKSYEITYISLQFCSPKPDSLAIYKSTSNGLVWTPYQFYSSQCKHMYGMEQSSPAHRAAPFEATCLNSSALGTGNPNQLLNSGRIAFSTLEGYNHLQHGQQQHQHQHQSLEEAAAQQAQLSDWISATDIRIVLDRHQASWIQSSLAVHSHHSQHSPAANISSSSLSTSSATINNNNNNNKLPQAAPFTATTNTVGNELQSAAESNANQLTNPSDTYNYALSDVTVGGRCKCNGHAQRCVHGEDGQLRCDCRHNTSGRDCEKCAPFHYDRPWQPASQMDANPCQPCQCNGHSRKCKFDPALYESSGRRSGGVCEKCRDNTDGRHCNYCREGFTRDHSKAMSHKEACKPCNCHPVGSSGRVCNQTTGQCPCKEGVTGLECTRCAPGYQQSSSPSEPCIKLPENDINSYEPIIEPNELDATDNVQAVNTGDQELAPPAAGRFKQPPTGHINNNNNKALVPDAEASPADAKDFLDQDNAGRGSGHQLDDLDETDPQQQQPQHQVNAMKARNQRPRYQANPSNQWNTGRRPQSSRQDGYYWNSNQFGWPRHPQFIEHDLLEEPLDDYGGGGDQPSYRVHPHQAGYGQMMMGYGKSQRPTNGNGKLNSKVPTRSGQPTNLVVEDVNSVDEPAGMDPTTGGYAPPQNPLMIDAAGNSAGLGLDSIDDASYNEIHKRPPLHASGGHSFIRPIGGRPHNSYNHHQHNLQRHQLQPYDRAASSSSASRRRLQDAFEQPIEQPPPGAYAFAHQPAPAKAVTCAQCQATIRKITRRQFCHLDYAIKALVLSRAVADDWTRYEVEVQDIFKSAQQISRANPITTTTSQLDDNSLQSDDPNVVGNSSPPGLAGAGAASNETSATGQNPNNDQQQQQQQRPPPPPQQQPAAHHQARMKIGSIQTIWVPTEDVTCRCPRLKLETTYLLLGLVDKSENSPTSIQLDRHGVAAEWKPNLQGRLIKIQRWSRKGCQ